MTNRKENAAAKPKATADTWRERMQTLEKFGSLLSQLPNSTEETASAKPAISALGSLIGAGTSAPAGGLRITRATDAKSGVVQPLRTR
jgi:hypothetical protein